MIHGGTAGELYHVEDTVYAVDIALDRALALGEATSLRYVTRFRYARQPRLAFVRPVPRTAHLIEIEVFFHKKKMPANVWFTVWEDWSDDSPPLYEERVPPDAAYRLLTEAGGTVVGFRWEW